MNNLQTINGIQKMSSNEIAELTGKRHDHVSRDIEGLNRSYEKISLPKIGESEYTTARGKIYREYLLTKMQTLDLLSGYSAELRIMVLRRWEELEIKNTAVIPNFSNPADAARAWADEYEKRKTAENEINTLKPRALLADEAIRDESKQYSITDAGKHLGIRQSDMFSMLRSDNMLTKKNLPTQRALDKGILSVRTNVTENGNRPQSVMTMENIYFFTKRYDFYTTELSDKETLKPLFEIKKLGDKG